MNAAKYETVVWSVGGPVGSVALLSFSMGVFIAEIHTEPGSSTAGVEVREDGFIAAAGLGATVGRISASALPLLLKLEPAFGIRCELLQRKITSFTK